MRDRAGRRCLYSADIDYCYHHALRPLKLYQHESVYRFSTVFVILSCRILTNNNDHIHTRTHSYTHTHTLIHTHTHSYIHTNTYTCTYRQKYLVSKVIDNMPDEGDEEYVPSGKKTNMIIANTDYDWEDPERESRTF